MLRPAICLRALLIGSTLTLGLSAFAACSGDSSSGFTETGGSGGADAGASGDPGSGGTTSGGTGGASTGSTTGKTGGGAPTTGGSAGSPAAGRGGEPSGGSSSGGKASSGGSSTGGTSSGGKASGGSASGGESGAPGKEACQLSPDTGPCDGAFPRFYFDAASGLCEPFSYGGCEGNENNFESMDDCYAACGGEGDVDLTACETSAECTLVDRSCCAACEPVSLRALVAINSSQTGAYVGQRPCTDVLCEECPMPGLDAERPWFGATCREGHCVPFDARETELTECVSSDDCSLRMGFGCCEGCSGATGVVAINDDADLETWLCGGLVACPACEPIFPESLEAACEDDRCQVVDQSQ